VDGTGKPEETPLSMQNCEVVKPNERSLATEQKRYPTRLNDDEISLRIPRRIETADPQGVRPNRTYEICTRFR